MILGKYVKTQEPRFSVCIVTVIRSLQDSELLKSVLCKVFHCSL
jgi:hypothetical protein